MKEIINRVTFTVAHKFTANKPSFQRLIPVNIKADEVIVRQMSYGYYVNDNGLSYIQSNLTRNGDGILGHVYAADAGAGPPPDPQSPMTVTPNARFELDSTKINMGSATFSIVTLSGTGMAPNMVADGLLLMTLEFIEYKK